MPGPMQGPIPAAGPEATLSDSEAYRRELFLFHLPLQGECRSPCFSAVGGDMLKFRGRSLLIRVSLS